MTKMLKTNFTSSCQNPNPINKVQCNPMSVADKSRIKRTRTKTLRRLSQPAWLVVIQSQHARKHSCKFPNCVLQNLDLGTALKAASLFGHAAVERTTRFGPRQGSARVGDHGLEPSADSLLQAATFGNKVAGSTLARKVERVLVRDVVVPGSVAVAAVHAHQRRAKGVIVDVDYISGIDDWEIG